MQYIIMADGEGKRWGDYLGIPKHLVKINGEPLIARTVRLLKENGVTDIIITSRDSRYDFEGTTRIAQSVRDCEIDRFEESTLSTCGDRCLLHLWRCILYRIRDEEDSNRLPRWYTILWT